MDEVGLEFEEDTHLCAGEGEDDNVDDSHFFTLGKSDLTKEDTTTEFDIRLHGPHMRG